MAGALTKKEEGFARDIALGDGASDAYRNNYNAENMKAETIHVKACQLKNKDKIRVRIDELKAKVVEVADKEFKIDAAWVLSQAAKVHQMCMQAEPVIVGGEPTGEFKFDSSGANKSLEIIGKHVDVQAFLTKRKTELTLSDDFDSLLGESLND